MITLDKLRKELDFFSKMYDIVRIVDPVEKKVLEYRQNGLVQTKSGFVPRKAQR